MCHTTDKQHANIGVTEQVSKSITLSMSMQNSFYSNNMYKVIKTKTLSQNYPINPGLQRCLAVVYIKFKNL